MKTKWVVLLTAMASFTLFTLFAYCTKDGNDPAAGGLTATEPTIDLAGTTWKHEMQYDDEGSEPLTITARFNSEGLGVYNFFMPGEYGCNFNKTFTFSLNGNLGKIHCATIADAMNGIRFGYTIPGDALLAVIDGNNISIGGRVFTKQ